MEKYNKMKLSPKSDFDGNEEYYKLDDPDNDDDYASSEELEYIDDIMFPDGYDEDNHNYDSIIGDD